MGSLMQVLFIMYDMTSGVLCYGMVTTARPALDPHQQ